MIRKRGLQLPPGFRTGESVREEETKSNEEPLVDDFVTPRFAGLVSLHLQPHEVAQHRARGFVALAAEREEAMPEACRRTKKGARPWTKAFSDQG